MAPECEAGSNRPCPACGEAVDSKKTICPRCGATVPSQAKSRPTDDEQRSTDDSPSSPDEWLDRMLETYD